MDFNDVGYYPDRVATEDCPSMKEQKEILYCHIFEMELDIFVYDVGSNELQSVGSELTTE